MSAGHILISTSQILFLRIQEKKQQQFFSNSTVEEIMKATAKIVLAAIVLLFTITTGAEANNRGVDGLIIGSGAGAIMGQAIGRNAEATIIGATVGGILGAVIGAESGQRHNKSVIVHDPPHRPHYKPAPRRYYSGHHAPQVVYREPRFKGYKTHRYPPQKFARGCKPGFQHPHR